MNKIWSFLTIFVMLPFSLAYALPAGVTEAENANVRAQATSAADIVYVYEYFDNSDLLYNRRAQLFEQKGDWFRVGLPTGNEGWMHKSLLGFCAGYARDTSCVMRKRPTESAPKMDTVKAGTQLALEELSEGWARVSYTKNGKKMDGWMSEYCLIPAGFCPALKEATLTFRNNTDYFPLITATIISDVETRVVDLLINEGQSIAIRKPANITSKLDLYMGMPSAIHFHFDNVPIQEVDTLVIDMDADGKPRLQLFFANQHKGTILGIMTHDDGN